MSEPKFTPGYEVTPDGKVFSVGHDWRGYGRREMAQQINSDGYAIVRLTIEGKRKKLRVHQIVCGAFNGPKPTPSHEVRHPDGNRMNNVASNLAWGTRAENAADRADHGKTARGKSLSAAIRAGMAASTNPYYRHARGQAHE